MKDLAGKTAFMTGGASGIGLGIAHAFVAAGMNVVIADLRQDHIDSAHAEFRERGPSGQVHAIRLDETDRIAMAAAAAETVHTYGKLHLLVSNAGVGIQSERRGQRAANVSAAHPVAWRGWTYHQYGFARFAPTTTMAARRCRFRA